jgi:putative CocE/NonD family hydrolase
LLEITRYWRSAVNPATGQVARALNRLDRFLLENDYAVIKVDVRGSGASFGTRPVEYGPQEVRDGYDVVEWVVSQAWSSGAVGAYGTSYTGTTAELLAGVKHPALRAVIPGWSDFDIYVSPVRPYGMLASSFISEWSRFVGWLDDNNTAALGASVSPVDEDTDGVLLAAALAEHAANPDVFRGVLDAEFRDDVIAGGFTYDSSTSMHWKEAIEASAVPMLVFASWLDAGTADGALLRFQHYSNPQKLVILASNHGGGFHASPFTVGSAPKPPTPSVRQQFEMRVAFLDHYLKGEDTGVEDWPAIRYFNMGSESLEQTDTWPPRGTVRYNLYLHDNGALRSTPPTASSGADEYTIDYTVSTGTRNRWMTQMGNPVLNMHDRGAMDDKMLVYDTPPMEQDLQIVGTPVVSLHVDSDHGDGALLVYLEDVDENGVSRYLTEGGLRVIHRRVSGNPHFDQTAPHHSFAAGDAAPMVPGEVAEITFQLWPTSVVILRGHRLRLAIAGADADTFDRIPATGTPTISVHRTATHASHLDLPVVPRNPGGSSR